MEESSSSDHKVSNPCSLKKKSSKGKTKLSQIKPGDGDKTEACQTTKASRWKGRQNREKRFTFVLAVVIGVFVICWFPFFFTYTFTAFCDCCVPETLFKFFFWFGYCNSSLNPIIYTIFNNDFRRSFKKILCRRDKRRVVWTGCCVVRFSIKCNISPAVYGKHLFTVSQHVVCNYTTSPSGAKNKKRLSHSLYKCNDAWLCNYSTICGRSVHFRGVLWRFDIQCVV